ncbi:hypothetical protein [Halothermothrix orenii]|uniref:Uncharacterized protein n=1 Tax=Halothermothrix orenii (strain H 168 / OCM 544 / DSM 9562) TaxID=373903 RepID=B8CZ33_HALOH|nr:hypothetical protein [Halothermothrix orenii]ACL70552.1 hypothetical protein Hore_18030 [Halothermothrix orenii H 168]
MVIEHSSAFAMRCPTCGRLEVNQLNIFQLSGNKTHRIKCQCGRQKVSFKRKGRKFISIKFYCIICDREHVTVIPRDEFFTKNHLNVLVCPNTELNLGYYGSYLLLREELNRQQEELNSIANEMGFDDFNDPEIMLEVLDHLHDIAAEGSLFCECGSHDINIDLFSDKIQLLCNNCNSSLVVPASTREDVDLLKNKDEVIIKMSKKPGSSKDPKINI